MHEKKIAMSTSQFTYSFIHCNPVRQLIVMKKRPQLRSMPRWQGCEQPSQHFNLCKWWGQALSTVVTWPCVGGAKSVSLMLYDPSVHRYRWAFIPEASDDSGLEVRRQGIHQREFKPYVVRLAKLLRKRAKVLHLLFLFHFC